MASKKKSEKFFDVDAFLAEYRQETRNYERHKELTKYRSATRLRLPSSAEKKMGKKYV